MATIRGTSGDDNLVGTDQDDLIEGLEGNDTINGGFGADTLLGGAGNDTFVFSAVRFSSTTTPNGLIDGGSNFDTINFSSVSPVSISITTGSAPSQFIPIARVGSQRFELRGIERILLGSSDNSIDVSNSTISANPGIEIYAGGGNDEIFTQAGASVFGEDGNDRFFVSGQFGAAPLSGAIHGGNGTDTLRTNNLFIIDLAAGTGAAGTASFAVSGFEILQANPSTSGPTTYLGDNLNNIFEINPLFADDEGSVVFDGRGGNDTLTGGRSADTISGGSGNDIITGGGGSDTLDGGTGFDEALYSGVRRTFRVSTATENGGVVTKIAFGPEGGTDTVRNVELARFTDGVLSFDPAGNAAKVLRMYNATFQRGPDPSGYEVWLGLLNNGFSFDVMASEFAGSGEFAVRFGSLSNQQFVEQLYQFTLGRPGDGGGIQFWTGFLNSGNSRGDMLREFSESAEHVVRTSEQLAQGLWIADPQARIAARMYDSALGRLPDSGGLGFWTQQLKGGTSVIGMANEFANGGEFQARFGALTNQRFVEQLYLFALDRAADGSGLQFWTGFLNNGGSRGHMLAEFSESAEHVNGTAVLWYDGISIIDGTSQSGKTSADGSIAPDDLAAYDLDALFAVPPGAATREADMEAEWEAALAAIEGANDPMTANFKAAATLGDTLFTTAPEAIMPDLMIVSDRSLDYLIHEMIM